jgi:hypothetical protein
MNGIHPEIAESDAVASLDAAACDVLIVGHTHLAFERRIAGGRVICNPGALLRDPAEPLDVQTLAFRREGSLLVPDDAGAVRSPPNRRHIWRLGAPLQGVHGPVGKDRRRGPPLSPDAFIPGRHGRVCGVPSYRSTNLQFRTGETTTTRRMPKIPPILDLRTYSYVPVRPRQDVLRVAAMFKMTADVQSAVGEPCMLAPR